MVKGDEENTPKDEKASATGVPWWVTAAGVILVPILVALLTSVVTQYYTASQKARDQDIRMVEIALSLVTPDPESGGAKGAREFAVDLLQKYSGVTISDDERASMISTAVVQTPPSTPASPAPPRLLGSEEVVVLDEPGHTLQWTAGDGTAIDFSKPLAATLIKAKTPSIKIVAGHLGLADRYVRSMSDTSDPVQFNAAILKYLKSTAIRTVPTGTCLNLLYVYDEQIDGIRIGKAEDADCP
jgi:hypothetical protein